MGIATSNSPLLVETVLKAQGIFEYFDSIHTANEVEKGKPAPDIYLLVAKDLGVEIEYVSTEAANRVEYLETGKVDIVLANFTVTEERAEAVDFALPYMKVALGVVSPEGNLITKPEQLRLFWFFIAFILLFCYNKHTSKFDLIKVVIS